MLVGVDVGVVWSSCVRVRCADFAFGFRFANNSFCFVVSCAHMLAVFVMDVVFPPEELTLDERMLHERAVRDGQEHINSEARILTDVMEVDQNRFYHKLDCRSTHAYCCRYMRLTSAMASNFINVARKSREVPALCEAVLSGELGVSTARKLVPVIEPENAAAWIEKAKTVTKDRLEREIADAAPEAHARMCERTRKVYRDRVEHVFSWPESAEAEFQRAREVVSQSLGHGSSDEETMTAAVRVFLYYKDPVVRAKRREMRRKKSGRVSQDTSSRRGRRPGRRRKLSAALRSAVDLEQRRCCQARKADGSICGATHFIHYHHRVPKAEGGQDTVENIITLCGSCHRRWHKLGDTS